MADASCSHLDLAGRSELIGPGMEEAERNHRCSPLACLLFLDWKIIFTVG
jgi:hypothetical protein